MGLRMYLPLIKRSYLLPLSKFDINALLHTEARMRQNTQREIDLKDQLSTLKKKRKYKFPLFRSSSKNTQVLDEISNLGEH